MKHIRAFFIDYPKIVTLIFAAALYIFAKESGKHTSEHDSAVITSVLTIAAIAVGYLTTCKSIIATRLSDKWMDVKEEGGTAPSLREQLVRAFIDAIRASIALIGFCVVITVKGNAGLEILPSLKPVVFPWGECFIVSLSVFLTYTLRASLVFNGFTIEICNTHDTNGRNHQ